MAVSLEKPGIEGGGVILFMMILVANNMVVECGLAILDRIENPRLQASEWDARP